MFGTDYHGNLFSAQFNPHRVQRHIVLRRRSDVSNRRFRFPDLRRSRLSPHGRRRRCRRQPAVLDTGAWFIHGCPISRVAKPEIKGAIYRVRRQGAKAVEDPRGSKLDLRTMQMTDVAKLLDDARPAVRQRAVEFLVSPELLCGVTRGHSEFVRQRRVTCSGGLRALPHRRGRGDAAVRAALSDSDFLARTAAARCAGMSRHGGTPPAHGDGPGDEPPARRQAIAALGQIGDARAMPALLAAAANPEDRFVEHSTIYSLISLNQPMELQKQLSSADFKVRKAALIALDQLDSYRCGATRSLPCCRRAKRSCGLLPFGLCHDIRTGLKWCLRTLGIACVIHGHRRRNSTAFANRSGAERESRRSGLHRQVAGGPESWGASGAADS